MTDTELLELFQNDEEKAIKLFFEQYYTYLCKVVYKILPYGDVAEDIVQDVFYDFWKKRDNLNIKTSVKAYLRKSSVNKALNHIRNNKFLFSENISEEKPISDPAQNPAKHIETKELQEKIDAAITKLPNKCRLVFSLSRFEDMSYKEIAQHLDISIKTVENQISKALKLLRRDLSSYLQFLVLVYTLTRNFF